MRPVLLGIIIAAGLSLGGCAQPPEPTSVVKWHPTECLLGRPYRALGTGDLSCRFD